MLFNSYEFIFMFLPITALVFFAIGWRGHKNIAMSWLVGASFFFYGWWNPAYLSLIIASILTNYAIGLSFSKQYQIATNKQILFAGIAVNLLALGYFKYANFFVENINHFAGFNFHLETIVLPLAISFFTFQQIAYLVDTYKGETKEYNFLHYCLFVTFFPQLIAGPIVHHKEMMPQFSKKALYQLNPQHVAVGLTIFTLGLFKKVVLADNAAIYATPIFNLAETQTTIYFIEAWTGALAYSFQLYFDFSGYSDMAIGIARIFGIRLPLNFNSPYRSTNIIDFWRRWHITLSRFLRDYLYIPLGGSRKGAFRRQINLMITMLLGGLWHGAGWNFVLWGGLHGIYLVINHYWKTFRPKQQGLFSCFLSWSLTFFCVSFAWVPFRSVSLDATLNLWAGMLGLHGFSLPRSIETSLNTIAPWLKQYPVIYEGMFHIVYANSMVPIVWIVVLLIVSACFPNTQQIMRRYRPAYETYKGEVNRIKWKALEWSPSIYTLLISVFIFLYTLACMSNVSEFLYFNF